MGTDHDQDRKKQKKGKLWQGLTARELVKGKNLAVFRILRTIQDSVIKQVSPLDEPRDVTDTIAIAPTMNGGYVIAGSIESPLEPRFIKKRGADIATGRAIAALNGKTSVTVPQSIMHVEGKVTPEVLAQFLEQLGQYDHERGSGFPYETISHKGTKGRPITESLAFMSDVSSKLRPPEAD
jgi:hypothetical protein